MPDYAGALERAAISRTLWLLIAPLAVALAFHAWSAARAPTGVPGDRAIDRHVGVFAVGLVTGATVVRFLRLIWGSGPCRASIEHLARGPQIGALDGSLALLFDPMSASASACACLLALGVAIRLASRRVTEPARVWACLELALAGALLTYLADGLVTTAFGWTIAAAATVWLAGWSDAREGAAVATRSAFAIAALVLGGAWFFWAAGGTWDEGAYTRDGRPEFAAIRSDLDAHGFGTITLLDAPGALVYLDEARAPLATAPFAGVRVPVGAHVLRVRSGAATPERVLDIDVPEPGASLVLVESGPSLSFRSWALARVIAADSSSEIAEPPHRVVAVALWVWVAAAWALSAMAPPVGAPLPLAALAYGATTAPLGPFLLARVAVLAPGVRGMKLVLAGMGAAILVVSAEALWVAATLRRRAAVRSWRAGIEVAPLRVGVLLERFERWVLDAIGAAAIGSVGVAGWIADYVERGPRGGARPESEIRRARSRDGVQEWLGVGRRPLAAIGLVLAAAAILARTFWVARRGGPP